MNGYVNYQPDSPVNFITKRPHMLVRICIQAQFLAQAFTVKCPAFNKSIGEYIMLADCRKVLILPLETDLVVVTRNGFMQKKAFHPTGRGKLPGIDDGY